MNFAAQIMLCEGENTPISAIPSLASYAGVFRGARISSLPLVGGGRNTGSPKTPTWEAIHSHARLTFRF